MLIKPQQFNKELWKEQEDSWHGWFEKKKHLDSYYILLTR